MWNILGGAFSQNAWFECASDAPEVSGEPPGLGWMAELASDLESAGWSVMEPELWRGTGWSANASRTSQDRSEIVLVVAKLQGIEWMVQIAPSDGVGVLAGLLGRKPSATAKDCYHAARAVHGRLSAQSTKLRWRWNAPPDERNGTGEPERWKAPLENEP